ncbi:MAG: hypothetical protein WC254_02320 [Candidatus Woesearchaeota archaeon]|jgi:hypothetical protein
MISQCAENGIIAQANTWSVSLLLFNIGETSFPLFIITRKWDSEKQSELFYFSAAAEKAFCNWINIYRELEKENNIEIF